MAIRFNPQQQSCRGPADPQRRPKHVTHLNFFGDVCLYNLDTQAFSIDPRISALSDDADTNIANLESPLTYATERRPYKQIYMKGEPKQSPILDLFDAFSLANNHMLDYQEKGMVDTIDFLSSLGKQYFGAGEDRKSSFEPLLIQHGDLRIAILGCSQWQHAGRKSIGTTPNSARDLCRTIRRLDQSGHFVVVFPHWNYEYMDYPAPVNRKFAHRLIDAGARLIVGSHPHVAQGYEEYKRRYIFHSLGNFVFREFGVDDSRITDTFILVVKIGNDREYDVDMVPVFTDENGIRIMEKDESDQFETRINEISEVFENDDTYINAFYDQASQGADRISGELRKMIKQFGIMYIISRLHRITMQDLKIKFRNKLRRFQ